MFAADTPSKIQGVQALVVASALNLYAKTGMSVNRAYTPKNMMATAESILGKKFKARDYAGAAKALREFAGVV